MPNNGFVVLENVFSDSCNQNAKCGVKTKLASNQL